MAVPTGFEPVSPDWKSGILNHLDDGTKKKPSYLGEGFNTIIYLHPHIKYVPFPPYSFVLFSIY